MIIKNLGMVFAFISVCITLQSCSQTSESNVTKNTNSNQSLTVSNLNSANNSAIASNSSEMNNNPVSNGNSLPAAGKKSVSKVSDPPPKIGSGGDDLSLLLQARNKLSSDKDLINSVIVEVNQGNAVLSGKVSNEDQKKRAEQLVSGVEGIKSTKNNLRVSP